MCDRVVSSHSGSDCDSVGTLNTLGGGGRGEFVAGGV